MDQIKIGAFLKQLRKEKNMTQEQLAEIFGVAGRTVSRWETGNNMPDLSILIELADFYDVDIREIIDGERKSEIMNSETKETLKKVAQYSEAEQARLKRKMWDMSIGAALLLLLHIFLDCTHGFGFIEAVPRQHLQDFVLGLALAVLVLNAMYLSGRLDRIRQWKLRTFKKK